MPKRKHRKGSAGGTGASVDVEMGGTPKTSADNEVTDSDSEEFDEVNVDFEMFDPQPAHDFHGLKTLLRQLFDIDSTLFDISALAELILSQPLVGTTVKVGTNESDPYAFLTVLNVNLHRKSNPAVDALATYILGKSRANEKLFGELGRILGKENGAEEGGLGLILTERMVNMPVEVAPPMYKMLNEEVEWALEEREPYDFEAFLVLSKTYTEVPCQLDMEDKDDGQDEGGREEGQAKPKAKRFRSRLREVPRKKTAARAATRKGSFGGKQFGEEVFYFHPEDSVIHQDAIAYTDFKYTKSPELGSSGSKRTFSDFGIAPQGHMILFKQTKLGQIVKKLEDTFKPS